MSISAHGYGAFAKAVISAVGLFVGVVAAIQVESRSSAADRGGAHGDDHDHDHDHDHGDERAADETSAAAISDGAPIKRRVRLHAITTSAPASDVAPESPPLAASIDPRRVAVDRAGFGECGTVLALRADYDDFPPSDVNLERAEAREGKFRPVLLEIQREDLARKRRVGPEPWRRERFAIAGSLGRSGRAVPPVVGADHSVTASPEAVIDWYVRRAGKAKPADTDRDEARTALARYEAERRTTVRKLAAVLRREAPRFEVGDARAYAVIEGKLGILRSGDDAAAVKRVEAERFIMDLVAEVRALVGN